VEGFAEQERGMRGGEVCRANDGFERWRGLPGKAEPLPLLYARWGYRGGERNEPWWSLPGKAEPLPLLYARCSLPDRKSVLGKMGGEKAEKGEK